MSDLIGLLIKGALIALVLGSIYAAFRTFEEKYYVGPARSQGIMLQYTADKPLLDDCVSRGFDIKGDKDAIVNCSAQNAQARADVVKWQDAEKAREGELTAARLDIDARNKQIADNKKLSDTLIANAHAIAVKQTQNAAQFASENERLRLLSQNPAIGATPNDRLKTLDATLTGALSALPVGVSK